MAISSTFTSSPSVAVPASFNNPSQTATLPSTTSNTSPTEVPPSNTDNLSQDVPSTSKGPSQTDTGGGESTDNRLDGGAVAGVAVGCLIAGLIIGAIVMWLVFRAKGSTYTRRRRRSEDRGRLMRSTRDDNSVALESTRKPMKLENVILQPAPDKEIISDLNRLDDIIRQHVETVYHFEPVDVKVTALAHSLTAIGYSERLSGLQVETVATWCIQTDTRCGALRHVLSHILFSSIDWNSPGSLTLLPKPAIGFLNSIRPIREYRNNFDVMSFAWTRWRTLTALFLHPSPQDRTPLEVSEDNIQGQVETVAKALDSVLRYFVAPDEESQHQQHDHLRVMIIETAKLGYTFFSHTSDWKFIYKDDYGKRGLVLCVGLEKLCGSDGHRLGSPQRIVEPRVMA